MASIYTKRVERQPKINYVHLYNAQVPYLVCFLVFIQYFMITTKAQAVIFCADQEKDCVLLERTKISPERSLCDPFTKPFSVNYFGWCHPEYFFYLLICVDLIWNVKIKLKFTGSDENLMLAETIGYLHQC